MTKANVDVGVLDGNDDRYMANIRIHDVAVKCDDREHGVIASRQPAVCTENLSVLMT